MSDNNRFSLLENTDESDNQDESEHEPIDNKQNKNKENKIIKTASPINNIENKIIKTAAANNNIENKIIKTSSVNNTENKIIKIAAPVNNNINKPIRELPNLKRILCYNILTIGGCNYGNKCVYAHSLDEQNIDSPRKKIYELILGKEDLSHINLLENKDLYKNLIQLTKICAFCLKGTCPGGHNCKFGVHSEIYQICYDDLTSGECSKRDLCKSIHLSKRGLVPFNKQKIEKYKEEKQNKKTYSDMVKSRGDKPDVQIVKPIKNIKPVGTLLTDDFFSHFDKKKVSDSDSEESPKSVDRIFKYLNDESEDTEDESIFC